MAKAMPEMACYLRVNVQKESLIDGNLLCAECPYSVSLVSFKTGVYMVLGKYCINK